MNISLKHILFLLTILLNFYVQANNRPDDFPPHRVAEKIDQLSQQCWDLREPYSDSALNLGLEAMELAELYNFPEKQAKASNFIGVVHLHYLNNYRAAIPYFQKAMRISIMLKDSIQIGYAYNNLGDVFLLNGNLPLALQYDELSYQIFEKLGDEEGLAYALINLAEVHRAKKNYQKSIEYFKRVSEIRYMLAESRMGFVAFNRARTLEESGEIEAAKEIYKKSLEYSYDSDDFRYVSWSLNGLANIYYIQESYDTAYDYYSKALEWNRERNHEFGYIDNCLGMALIHAHKNELPQGLEKIDIAIKISIKQGINTKIIKSYNSLLEFYKILGDSENLKKSFDLFISTYDSILSAQQFEIVNEMERSFSIQQDLLLSEKQLEQDDKERTILFLIIFFMIIIMLFVFWQYRSHKKMNLKLEEMNQTKDKLFSVISHDLKNPFNTMVGFSDILLSNIEDQEYKEAHKHAKLINKASLEGFKQLTNLLNWSLSQSGKIQFNPTHIDLSSVLDEIEALFQPEINMNQVKLSIINPIQGKVFIDPNIVKIILENLLSNAFKFTPEGGSIQLTAHKSDQQLQVEVTDSGIGIPEDVILALNEKNSFIKSQKGLRKESGTGLGLSIVYELIKIHKAQIRIESQPEKGTGFYLSFPME